MSSPSLTIQVIMIGCTAGYQYMTLEAISKLLSLREPRPYKLLPVLCCGADKYTDTVTSTMTNQQMCTPWVRTFSESELETRVGALLDQWHKDSVRLFIWTTLPMSAMNYVTEEDPEEARHAVTTRYVSFSTELSARVMPVVGQTAVVEVFLAPFDLALNIKTVLESLFGPPMAHVGLQAINDSCDEILLFCNLNPKDIEVIDMGLADRRGPIDRTVVDSVAIVIDQSSKVARSRDHRSTLRIEGHAKAVVRQGVAGSLRNAKAIGDRKRKFDRRIHLRQSTARKECLCYERCGQERCT
jgi:hypothetical protein